MKKVVLLIAIISFLFFSSCGQENERNSANYVADKSCSVIVEAIQNDEPEKIKELFCEKLLKKHDDIDQKIEEFIHFIDGDIVAVGRQIGERGEHSTQYPYGLIYEAYTGSISDIITDSGKRYRIRFDGLNVDFDSTDTIGIVSIVIVDVDKLKETENYDESSYFIK